MLKLLMTATSAALMGSVAAADGHYSALIATEGLSGAEQSLAAIAAPTPSDQFALGGVRFLRTVETALQTRYRYGMTGALTDTLDLPLLRLPIFDNPAAQDFTPAVVNTVFSDALVHLEGSLAVLDTIGDADAVAVALDTGDLWFDINMNAKRDPGEGLFEVVGGDLDRDLAAGFTPPVIQFDTADAAWLSAYAHMLSGASEAILAFDPATLLSAVLPTGAQMDELRGTPFIDNNYFIPPEGPAYVDIIAAAVMATQVQPDVTRSRAAHAHFLGMIADNKSFWARVAVETDNDNEWIPNKNQISALPLEFPADTSIRWRAFLADAEALLTGKLLIPHWRLGDGAGIDLAALMQDPPVLDIVGILQGRTVLPYAKRGRLMNSASLNAFEELVGGDAPLYMIVLN